MTARRVLLIKPKRIGDLLLLTPTVLALKQVSPGIRVEVLAYDKSEKILEGFHGAIDRVWTVTGDWPTQRLTDDSLLKIRFDDVIELSGQPYAAEILNQCIAANRFRSVLYGDYGEKAWVAAERAKLIFRPEWRNKHAACRDWLIAKEALQLPELPKLELKFPKAKDGPLASKAKEESTAVFYPFSRDPDRTWPIEKWRMLAEKILQGGDIQRIIVPYNSPTERNQAMGIAKEIRGCCVPEEPPSFSLLADLARRATVCVTCNTGIMHLFAAVGARIVAVWGVAPIIVWHPFCESFRVVCGDQVISMEEARSEASPIQECLIGSNNVDTVIAAIAQLKVVS